MATADNYEAKTQSDDTCSLCEKPERVKFCGECETFLCRACALGHGKLKPTRHRKLEDVSQDTSGELTHGVTGSSRLKSGEGESGLGSCILHGEEPLNLYCQQCVDFLCEDCKTEHHTHDVEKAGDDPRLFQQVCRKYIQQLMDGENDMDEERKFLQSIICRYEEVDDIIDEVEKELTNEIKAKTKDVKTKLRLLKDEKSKELDARKEDTQNIDSQVSKLHAIRNISDCDVLSQALSEAKLLLTKLITTKEHFNGQAVEGAIQILPNISHKTAVKDGIDKVFTINDKCFTESRGQSPEHAAKSSTETTTDSLGFEKSTLFDIKETLHNLTKNDNEIESTSNPTETHTPKLELTKIEMTESLDVPLPEISGYRISLGDSHSCGTVILHSNDGFNIHLFCSKSRRFCGKYKSNISIARLVTTAPDEYVCTETGGKFIHLLDAKFNGISSRSGNMIRDIHYLSLHRFVMLIKSDKTKPMVCTMLVKDGQMVTQNALTVEIEVTGCISHIAINEDKTLAYLCSNFDIFSVNIERGGYTKYRIPWMNSSGRILYIRALMLPLQSVLVDQHGNILIATRRGRSPGYIYMFNKSIKLVRSIEIKNDSPRDVMITSGCMIVTTEENKIQFYS